VQQEQARMRAGSSASPAVEVAAGKPRTDQLSDADRAYAKSAIEAMPIGKPVKKRRSLNDRMIAQNLSGARIAVQLIAERIKQGKPVPSTAMNACNILSGSISAMLGDSTQPTV
jgi:hypothetical protein